MHRFFVPPDCFLGDEVTLQNEVSRQITLVLRLKPGDKFILLDNTGWEYEVRIGEITSRQVLGKVVKKKLGMGEPAIQLTLCQALLKADKMEFVLQKCVELGVSGFVPFICERTVAKEVSENKLERWRTIIREAAEQSGRSKLPVLHNPVSFELACKPAEHPSILLWEKEKIVRFADTVKNEIFCIAPAMNIFIGPEGGFSDEEAAKAKDCGIVVAGMGRRVLRAETAGMAAVSAVMYERGELG